MGGLFFLCHDNSEEKGFQKLFENPSILFTYEFKKYTLKKIFLMYGKVTFMSILFFFFFFWWLWLLLYALFDILIIFLWNFMNILMFEE